jgi:hypothetical protein
MVCADTREGALALLRGMPAGGPLARSHLVRPRTAGARTILSPPAVGVMPGPW